MSYGQGDLKGIYRGCRRGTYQGIYCKFSPKLI